MGKIEYASRTSETRTMSQEPAEKEKGSDLRARVREIIEEDRELFDALA